MHISISRIGNKLWKEINIAISASKFYIEYARVMLASVYAAHPKNKINLFVFYVDDKVATYQKIMKKAEPQE